MYMTIETIRQVMRNQIGEDCEKEFEQERLDNYHIGLESFKKDMEDIPNNEKELIRVKLMRDLRVQEAEIRGLWEEIIHRAAICQYIFNTLSIVLVAFAFIALFTLHFKFVFIFSSLSILTSLFMRTGKVFSIAMYYMTWNWSLTQQLYEAYGQYGTDEARLEVADYRNLLSRKRNFIFTTTLTWPPPN